LTKVDLPVEGPGQAGAMEIDEFFEGDKISMVMAVAGGLTLRNFTTDLGTNQAVSVAKRVFAAMRSVEVQYSGKERQSHE
jgi:hypothetical protein